MKGINNMASEQVTPPIYYQVYAESWGQTSLIYRFSEQFREEYLSWSSMYNCAEEFKTGVNHLIS